MSKEEGNILKFGFGLLSGIISGVVFGLLFAPKPGKEVRDDLAIKSEELKSLSKEKFSEIQGYSKTQADKVSSIVKEKASKISSRIDEFSKRGSDVLLQDELS